MLRLSFFYLQQFFLLYHKNLYLAIYFKSYYGNRIKNICEKIYANIGNLIVGNDPRVVPRNKFMPRNNMMPFAEQHRGCSLQNNAILSSDIFYAVALKSY